jgi:hypothetical protein
MSSRIAALSENLSQCSLYCSLETSYFYLVFCLSARRSICAAVDLEWGQQYPQFCFGLPSLPTRFGAHEKRMQRGPLCPFLAYLRERRLRLWQPQRHVHGAV